MIQKFRETPQASRALSGAQRVGICAEGPSGACCGHMTGFTARAPFHPFCPPTSHFMLLNPGASPAHEYGARHPESAVRLSHTRRHRQSLGRITQ